MTFVPILCRVSANFHGVDPNGLRDGQHRGIRRCELVVARRRGQQEAIGKGELAAARTEVRRADQGSATRILDSRRQYEQLIVEQRLERLVDIASRNPMHAAAHVDRFGEIQRRCRTLFFLEQYANRRGHRLLGTKKRD
jgi:hypothetical protein